MIRTTISTIATVLCLSTPASAHNVWCHCPDKNQLKTVEYFDYAGKVYEAFADTVRIWHDANTPLEEGVLAEFKYHTGEGKELKPELYRETLFQLQKLDRQFAVLKSRLIAMDKFVQTMDIAEGFESTLTKILAESTEVRRLSQSSMRYSDVGGKAAKEPDPMNGIRGIIKAQVEDLDILDTVLADVIVGLRDAMPLAEKGEFAAVMLSGRNMFGDRNPQFTNLFSAYERLYVTSCMATIAATMQVYPTGFEWLSK
jgi:hypothetical protein